MGLRIVRWKVAAIVSLLLSFALPTGVLAIGLGELQLKSPLNAPLEAEIHLLQVNDLGENEILINMAPQADFDRAGVERRYLLRNIKFKLDLENANGPVIRVFSREPIHEPFLNFIVEVMWPNGRLLREYVLLMDLPAFDGGIARPVKINRQKPSEESLEDLMAEIPAQYQVTLPTDGKPSARQAASQQGSVYGPVASNETLWAIAANNLPDPGVSVQQMMLAIQRMNPDAFINNNINLLKKGAVLRLPTLSDIQQKTVREAISEVAVQNAEWRGGQEMQPQIDATGSASPLAESAAEMPDRLTLVAPDAERDTIQGSGLGDDEAEAAGEMMPAEIAEGAGLEMDEVAIEEGVQAGSTQDAAMLEEMDRITRENEALKSDLGKLEEQLSTVDEILDLQNADMDAIEESIKQLASEKAAEKPKKVVSADMPADDGSSGFDFNLLFKILMVFVVATAIFVVYSRKRAAGSQAAEPELEWEAQKEEVVEEQPEEVAEVAEAPVEAEEPVVAQPETEDAIGEADIYISFGNFEKAEALLLSAISAEPGRSDLRLKLLEVFVETKDLTRFDEQLDGLKSTGDSNALEKAEALRSKIAGAEGEEDLLDIDLGLDEETVAPVEESFLESVEPETSLEDEFDLDSEETLEQEPSIDDMPVEQAAASEEAFDLDLSDEFLEEASEETAAETQPEEPSIDEEPAAELTAEEQVDEFIEDELEEQGVTEDEILQEAAEIDSAPAPVSEEAPSAAAAEETASSDSDEVLDEDETATKLELAKAYIDMGDTEGARDILEEVLEEGNDAQKSEAQSLINELD